jgi:hypothetical protein
MSPDDPRDPSGRRREARDGQRRDRLRRSLRVKPARGRRVRRTVRHIEPWSVLKIALLFHAALFLIICVASALLWGGARASGQLDSLESFITSVGGFGNCEPIDGVAVEPLPTTTEAPATDAGEDQLDPSRTTTDPTVDDTTPTTEVTDSDNNDCQPGFELVGAFKFEDGRVFEAFAFGGVVLVLAGTGAAVVLVLLFNLMSDLTGGVQVTVIEEEPRPRREASPPPPRRPEAGSPPPPRRD